MNNKFENYPVKENGAVFKKKIAHYGEKFCAAPWSTLIIENNSDIRFCCMAHYPKGRLTGDITEAFNSDLAKKVRKNFLNGVMERRATGSLSQKNQPRDITYCDKCWVIEKNHGHPHHPRVSNTDWAGHVIDDLVESTDSDGHMHKEAPAWLDIRFSNKCNFACMGCDISLSTTVGKYAPAYHTRDGWNEYDTDTPTRGRDNSLTEEECLEDTVDADALIKYIIDHRDTITHIHFQGGEPFMMPEVYKTLDTLIKYDMHKENGIHIWCHTNGSIREFRGEDIIKKYLLKWEDRFHITMSHDGMGKRGEYIRFGYRDKKWLDIFRRIKDAGCRMNIHHSINMFNVLHQEECLEWYNEHCFNKMDEIGITIQPWSGIFKLENIGYVPELVDNAIAQFENCTRFLTSVNEQRHLVPRAKISVEEYSRYLKTLHKLKTDGTDNEFNRIVFMRAITKFDQMRKTNFHKTFPELKPFWDYIS